MMKNGVYFILIALLVAELFLIRVRAQFYFVRVHYLFI